MDCLSFVVIVKKISAAKHELHKEYHGDDSSSISLEPCGNIVGSTSIPDPRMDPSP